MAYIVYGLGAAAILSIGLFMHMYALAQSL